MSHETSEPKKKRVAPQYDDVHALHVRGQLLVPDPKFVAILERYSLSIDDLRLIAESVSGWLQPRGWFSPTPTTIFVVDAVEGPDDFLFGYSSFLSDQRGILNGMVNANSVLVDNEIKKASEAVMSLHNENERVKHRNTMLRSSGGFALAHEITHAFGLNLSREQFKIMPLPDLEILTDSCALLSCEEIIGDAAYLGAHYLQVQLKDEGKPFTKGTFRDKAETVVSKWLAGPGQGKGEL